VTYHVLLTPDEAGGFDAVCPALKCSFLGETVAEAIDGIKAAIVGRLDELQRQGLQPPEDNGFVVALEVEDTLRERAEHGLSITMAAHEVEVATAAGF